MRATTPTSIVSLLTKRFVDSADEVALWTKSNGWQSQTWADVGRNVMRMASWLVGQGIKPGHRVAQFSENRSEWLVSDLAMHVAGAVHVPIHAPLTGEQAAFQIADSGADLVLLSTTEQVDKIAAREHELPPDLKCYVYDECDRSIGRRRCHVLSDELPEYDEVMSASLIDAAVTRATGEMLATILYTSGTTGEPKGVMLSNQNLVSNTLAAIEPFAQDSNDLRLSFLPLSHIFARTCDLYTWVASGSQLALAESRDTAIADCGAVRPTLLNGVPYFFEKLASALADVDPTTAPDALRDVFGGRIRLCCSGGAALPDHVFDFFMQRNVPLLQGYGLTETSPIITLSSEERFKRGSVGRAIPDVEVRIADDGEILTRGPHVMLGYFKNPAATDEVIRDNWFHTGDIGHLDDEGYLFITGRKKELIVTSGRKNIAPVYLESLLTQDPLIAQAVVIGDDRKYLTALIVPEYSVLDAEILSAGLVIADSRDVLTDSIVLKLIEEHIASRLSGVSHYEQVRKFVLLKQGFSVESGEMTPKLSLRREVIQSNYCDSIEAMYTGE